MSSWQMKNGMEVRAHARQLARVIMSHTVAAALGRGPVVGEPDDVHVHSIIENAPGGGVFARVVAGYFLHQQRMRAIFCVRHALRHFEIDGLLADGVAHTDLPHAFLRFPGIIFTVPGARLLRRRDARASLKRP